MTQETAYERTAIDFTEFEKAIEETSIFTHVEDAMWVADKAHQLIKANHSVSTEEISVEKLQEKLSTGKKALTEIRADIEEYNQIYDLSTDTALLLEGIDGIAVDALEALEGGRG